MSAALTFPSVKIQEITRGPQHHFFGYYDKFPWDASGHQMLGLETSFMDRPPSPGDVARIGLIDTQNQSWTTLAETKAWNWQQGCMLQWLGDGSSGDIIFNDRQNDRLVSRILNIYTREEKILDRPIYSVNSSGTHAVTLNFPRLQHQRPGYGYPGVDDPWREIHEPEDDGIFSLDLKTGESRLILSTAQAANFGRKADFDGKIHRFNHLQFSPSTQRFACLHRYKTSDDKGVGQTRLLTLNLDGTQLHCLSDHGLVSHYDWKDQHSILAWARRAGIGDRYFLFPDEERHPEVIGENVFSSDGHCSFSPDRNWLLTDTYPDETNHRTLLLFHWASGERIDLGRFYAPPMKWQIRCDLHPRWSRDGQKICIDSVHEGSRQIYVLDVSRIVNQA